MDSEDSTGLSIRLDRNDDEYRSWGIAVRNDGPESVEGLVLWAAQGGIMTPGDLGSTIGYRFILDPLGPSEERRVGSFGFWQSGEYLDIPLSVKLCAGDRLLQVLNVTPDDFDRLESLRGAQAPPNPL